MASDIFERLKAEIVWRVLENEHIKDECEFFEATFSNDGHSYVQGVADILPDPDLKVYFSIPRNTRNIFITVSDGVGSVVRKVIGNIEQLDVNDVSYFNRRQIVRFENENLNKQGIYGIVLLPLSVSGILDSIHEKFDFDNEEYCFHLVTMLSKAEMEVWEKDGFDSLMDLFDHTDKDLLTCEQKVD